MHETAIAQGLFDVIENEAKNQNAKPLSAKITCGYLSAVNDEVLKFAFEAISKDTICQNTKLTIDHKPLRAKCKECDKNFDIDISNNLFFPVIASCRYFKGYVDRLLRSTRKDGYTFGVRGVRSK